MALPSQDITYLNIDTNSDDVPSLAFTTNENNTETKTYINLILDYLRNLTLTASITDEQLQTAVYGLRKKYAILASLLSGQSHTYSDGAVLSRTGNVYSLSLLTSVDMKLYKFVDSTGRTIPLPPQVTESGSILTMTFYGDLGADLYIIIS